MQVLPKNNLIADSMQQIYKMADYNRLNRDAWKKQHEYKTTKYHPTMRKPVKDIDKIKRNRYIVAIILLLIIAIGFLVGLISLISNTNASSAVINSDANFAGNNVFIDGSASIHDQIIENPAPSTPRSEWHKGVMPYIYQTDIEWANIAYAKDQIAFSGCGPTCLNMVYVFYTGDASKTPVDFCNYATVNNYLEDDLTKWTFMTQAAADFGLNGYEIVVDKNTMIDELNKGNVLIASVVEGDFTDGGHFLVICGLDDAGNFIIRDPNSPENSTKSWNVDQVINQTRGAWTYTGTL